MELLPRVNSRGPLSPRIGRGAVEAFGSERCEGAIREASVSGHVETRKGLCSFVARTLLDEAIPQDAAFQRSTRCQQWGQRGSDGGASP